MTTLADMLDTADTIERQTAERRAALLAEQAAAEQARADADEAIEAAALEELAARRAGSHQFLTEMRRLTAEVRQARDDAARAVLTGDGDPLALWLTYRRTRARNQGVWLALGEQYSRVSGSPAPPGNWGPPVVSDPEAGLSAETFHDWLIAETAAAERQIRRRTQLETLASIHGRRGGQADEE